MFIQSINATGSFVKSVGSVGIVGSDGLRPVQDSKGRGDVVDYVNLRFVWSVGPLRGTALRIQDSKFQIQGWRRWRVEIVESVGSESYRISSIVQTAWQTASSSFRESASILFLSLCFETARI